MTVTRNERVSDMPKINLPDQVASLVPNLPHRLRQLRLEMGWSLDDLVPIVGVTQKGVVSNWEATNQRRRTPPITTLVILQRWYGVSLEYLIGLPDGERESVTVRNGKRALKDRLKTLPDLEELSPTERARFAVRHAAEVAPEAFFLDRTAACLGMKREDLDSLLTSREWTDTTVRHLAAFLGLKHEWFYTPDPVEVLNNAQ